MLLQLVRTADALPPRGGPIVAFPGVHPTALTVVQLFFFPKWRLGFKVVHNELTGLKCCVTVRRAHRNQYNLLAGQHGTNSVDNGAAKQGPALTRLYQNALDAGLGHTGVMLQVHRCYCIALVVIAHYAYKLHNCAAGGAAQLRYFSACIEILNLN